MQISNPAMQRNEGARPQSEAAATLTPSKDHERNQISQRREEKSVFTPRVDP